MTLYEISTFVLIAAVGAAATAAIFVGLLNWMGAFYVVRCAQCHHMTFSSANRAQESCAHCRHPALMHPIYASRHRPGIRVVDDHLHY
jgi:hypothetical protein